VLNFDLKTATQGTSALITVSGDLDIQAVEQVVDALTQIELTKPALLVIDLREISFMDSAGMGVIAAAHSRAVEADRRFVIVRPPPGVRRSFELSRLDEVITTVDDPADAYP
jgi:anti-anti-sigma factor